MVLRICVYIIGGETFRTAAPTSYIVIYSDGQEVLFMWKFRSELAKDKLVFFFFSTKTRAQVAIIRYDGDTERVFSNFFFFIYFLYYFFFAFLFWTFRNKLNH